MMTEPFIDIDTPEDYDRYILRRRSTGFSRPYDSRSSNPTTSIRRHRVRTREARILDLLEKHRVGSFASPRGNRPRPRDNESSGRQRADAELSLLSPRAQSSRTATGTPTSSGRPGRPPPCSRACHVATGRRHLAVHIAALVREDHTAGPSCQVLPRNSSAESGHVDAIQHHGLERPLLRQSVHATRISDP
jgi:hypothetical protein